VRLRSVGVFVGAVGLGVPAAVAAPQADAALVVTPAVGEIGVLYGGAPLTVTAEVDSGARVALLVTGARSDLHLRRQARVWGAFWAPSGGVTFRQVPSLYVLHASAALSELAPAQVLSDVGVGYESFRAAVVGDSGGVAAELFPELVRLKESERLFQTVIGEVRREPTGVGRERVTALINLPAKAPPGVYRIEVFGFRGQRLAVHQEASFTLTRGAFNGFFSALAERHGLLYGILAVALAIGAGLFVGLVFGSVKAH
jgi:uncharacterized protein (TIGR02186 family)